LEYHDIDSYPEDIGSGWRLSVPTGGELVDFANALYAQSLSASHAYRDEIEKGEFYRAGLAWGGDPMAQGLGLMVGTFGLTKPLSASGRLVSNKADESFTTFYHGTTADVASDIRVKGINLSRGSEYSDFGQGFYLTTSREEALLSAGRGLDPDTPLDVVAFRVPDSELSNLSSLRFKSVDESWQDFVKFHKTYAPRDLLHGGQAYDLVEGPLFRRYSGVDKTPIPWLDRTNQTSIHTQNSVDLFNLYMLRSE
jgi:hypothetical protein